MITFPHHYCNAVLSLYTEYGAFFHPSIEDEVKIGGKIVSLDICMIFPPSRKVKCLQELLKMQKVSQPHLVVSR